MPPKAVQLLILQDYSPLLGMKSFHMEHFIRCISYAAYYIHDMIYLRFETDPEQPYYLYPQRDQHTLLLHQSLTFSESKHIPKRRLYQAPVTMASQ